MRHKKGSYCNGIYDVCSYCHGVALGCVHTHHIKKYSGFVINLIFALSFTLVFSHTPPPPSCETRLSGNARLLEARLRPKKCWRQSFLKALAFHLSCGRVTWDYMKTCAARCFRIDVIVTLQHRFPEIIRNVVLPPREFNNLSKENSWFLAVKLPSVSR